jgi:hypothetical protein
MLKEFTWSPPDATEPVPVFRYRLGARSRDDWRIRVSSRLGRAPSEEEIRRIVLAGIDALASEPDDRATLVELWDLGLASDAKAAEIADRYRAATAADPEADAAPFDAEIREAALPPDRAAQLESLDAAVRRHHRPYADALERRATWRQEATLAAVRMFVWGWSDVVDANGEPLVYRRMLADLPDDTLARIDPDTVAPLGAEIINKLLEPAR